MPRNFYGNIKSIFDFMSNASKIILAGKFMIPIIIALVEGLSLWIVVAACVYLILEFLFIFLCIKQVKKEVNEGIREYEYEVIQRWGTPFTGMNDVLYPQKIIRIKDKIHELPHPNINHPSNKCKNCGENPTENKENNNETK